MEPDCPLCAAGYNPGHWHMYWPAGDFYSPTKLGAVAKSFEMDGFTIKKCTYNEDLPDI